jgi:cysteinyl-tRNA synthetase
LDYTVVDTTQINNMENAHRMEFDRGNVNVKVTILFGEDGLPMQTITESKFIELSGDALKEQIEFLMEKQTEAVDSEDWVEAARIRDMILELNKPK